MKEFKYKTIFSSTIKPLVSEEKDQYLAMASMLDIGDFIPDVDTKKDIDLSPAIHDVDGGFVYSCNKNEIRVTSGVELNFREAKLNEEQIKEAVQKLKTILPLKNKLTKAPWLGSRPTIADSLPMIGKAPKHKNLWFNFGHNHIGLSTSAGSGVVLADMIENKKTSINIDPFLPDRFML